MTHTFGPYLIEVPEDQPGHAKITRLDGAPANPSWYELQHMKDLAFGSLARAVEVFPEAPKLIDTRHFRHLWKVPENVQVPCIVDGKSWGAR